MSATVEDSNTNNDNDDDDTIGYIQTATHNYISRNALVQCAKQVEMKGRSVVDGGVKIYGNEMTWIRIGRYCHIQRGTVIIPPTLPNIHTFPNIRKTRMAKQQQNESLSSTTDSNNPDVVDHTTGSTSTTVKYIPVQIGSHSIIGRNCIIKAAAVGSYCSIGDNVTIMERTIIKDCCIIESNTYIPCDMVIPPYTRIVPNCYDDSSSDNYNAIITNRHLNMTELPPSLSIRLQEQTMEYYQEFSSIQRKKQYMIKS